MVKQFRINQGIALQRARKREYNVLNKLPKNAGCVTGTILARSLYPDQKSGTQDQSANRLTNGKIKMLSADQLEIIYHELGVDPNFLQDYPSIHDGDYIRLVSSQTF